ncbi:transcriptional regulator%2C AbrB family [Streptococcus pneumoniae]|nr:transcriptional regulator%2C AbrB family [Streptococcus pneumoniae]
MMYPDVNDAKDKLVSKVSSKGQTVIPSELRRQFGIESGTEIVWSIDEEGRLYAEPVPTQDDWAELLRDWPIEHVKMDENGKYNPDDYPEFHDWMVNG